MTDHKTGTREEWLAARLELLEAEKALTRRSDELARRRQELPWVRVDKDYRFTTEDGDASLRDLFGGRSQLLVYHFMFDPDWDEGCPSCSGVTDGFAGSVPHFEHHDVAFVVVSRAPLDKLAAYKRRMGWDFRWVSSFDSSFNHDFHVTIDPAVTPVEYNYKNQAQLEAENVAWRDWSGEQPGMSAFARDGDEVFHTYSRVFPRLRRAVADVAVAGPGAAGPQRRRRLMVPPARRIPRDRRRTVMTLVPIRPEANGGMADAVTCPMTRPTSSAASERRDRVRPAGSGLCHQPGASRPAPLQSCGPTRLGHAKVSFVTSSHPYRVAYPAPANRLQPRVGPRPWLFVPSFGCPAEESRLRTHPGRVLQAEAPAAREAVQPVHPRPLGTRNSAVDVPSGSAPLAANSALI